MSGARTERETTSGRFAIYKGEGIESRRRRGEVREEKGRETSRERLGGGISGEFVWGGGFPDLRGRRQMREWGKQATRGGGEERKRGKLRGRGKGGFSGKLASGAEGVSDLRGRE